MAYVPKHLADVFISYCHDDDFAWIERFKLELESALARKLRARTRPEIFFDAEDLRVGRLIDTDIPACLRATGFFLAIISRRYNNSTYCRQKELAGFLRHHPPESGRLIQVWSDRSAALPLPGALAIEFANGKGVLRPGTSEYDEAMRRVCEPIVSELDKLYAESKMIFLAWSDDPELEKERERLQSELEGRGLRVYPEVIASYEGDIRLRDALQESSASVHFLGAGAEDFEQKQLQLAVQVGRPCVVASHNRAEIRVGPPGSPAPIYLSQGNPTIAIANAIDALMGRGKRGDRDSQPALGKTGLFLVFKPDKDSTLGLQLRQQIVNRGPFEVIVPGDGSAGSRYDELPRAKAAVLCWGRAERTWFESEREALHTAIVGRELYDLPRALFLKPPAGGSEADLGEADRILHSQDELNGFLDKVQGAAS